MWIKFTLDSWGVEDAWILGFRLMPKNRRPQTTYDFTPLENYLYRRDPAMRTDGAVQEVADKRDLTYGCGLHPVLRLSYCSMVVTREEWERLFLAFLGPKDALDVMPYITDTVVSLCSSRNRGVSLPIVADAFQDAGLPEDHWLLDRLRDTTTPFVRSEWFHRQVLKRKRAKV